MTIGIIGTAACASTDDDDDQDEDGFDLDLGWSSCAFDFFLGGFFAWSAIRVVETIDVWAAPAVHNHRFRKLRARNDDPKWSFHVAPRPDGGATAGLAVRF